MHQLGPPTALHIDGPFYSNVILKNEAGKVR
jgi:hypothetical protein